MRASAMPHFHLRNDIWVEDNEGIELPDLAPARARATAYALDMSAASILERHRINLRHRIEVTNEKGELALAVEFGEVVTIET
jgi:hypothetical protein